MLFERQTLNDILTETPELRANGNWLCLNIEINSPWPAKPQPFTFEGLRLWLMPITTDNYPGIALNCPPNLSRDDAWSLLYRALSLIVWTQNTGAMIAHMSGGNIPRMMGLSKTTGVALRDEFDFSDLPEVDGERAKLALALMREGRGLNHPAYAFLSFFRVLETALPDGSARGAWMTENINNIEGLRAKEALAKLKQVVDGDIGVHLRDSGRHAIAHAKADPIINPDDPRDAKRLQAELPIMEALAVLSIEKQFGILTSQTIWKEHLYELKGWKSVFGDAVIAGVLNGTPPIEGQNVDAPILNIRLRRSAVFRPFESMTPLQASYGDGRIEVVYQSQDGLIYFIFWLNVVEERLEFDPHRSILFRDDGSADSARNGKDIDRFLRDYFGNGELQMWNNDTGELLSRCDAFIPINAYLNIDAANAAIDRWDAIIAEREQANLGE